MPRRTPDAVIERAGEAAMTKLVQAARDGADLVKLRAMVGALPERVVCELADLLYVEHAGRATTRVVRLIAEEFVSA